MNKKNKGPKGFKFKIYWIYAFIFIVFLGVQFTGVDTAKETNQKEFEQRMLQTRKVDKVIVEGVNSVITHKKQNKDSAGGRVPKNAPMHISNVALIDPKNDVATRVGFMVKDGKKVRIAKNSGEVIDG